MRELNPKEEGRVRPKPNNELQKMQIRATPDKFTFIGQELPKAIRVELVGLLWKIFNLFAWAPEDMPRIDPRVICHRLAIDLKV